MTVGEALKRFRSDFKLTQQEVADSIGALKPAYQRYEYGKNIPTATILIKIANAYNVSVDYLVGLTSNPNRAQ